MNSRRALSMALVGLISLSPFQTKGDAQTQEKPIVQIPKPGVPEIMTLEGKFVRVAYNNEGYVIIGYQATNRSVGEEWMLLEVGMTVLGRTPDYRLTRGAISLETPDGKTIPLPSTTEHRAGNTKQFSNGRMSSAIPSTTFRCPRTGRVPSFSFPTWDPARSRTTRWISATTAPVSAVSIFRSRAVSRYGQHWLNVKFQNSLVRVPFRILTKEEEQLLSKNYKSIEKQVKDAFKQK